MERALIDEMTAIPYDEPRFCAFGKIEGRVHALIFTIRGRSVRLIGLQKSERTRNQTI